MVATTSKNVNDITIDFDKSNMPSYLPARCEIKHGEYLKSDIDRIHSVNSIIKNNNDFESINFDKKIKYTICNNDWYICVDEDNKIYGEIIDIDKRAFLEFKKCYDAVLEKYNIINQDYKKFIKK